MGELHDECTQGKDLGALFNVRNSTCVEEVTMVTWLAYLGRTI